jgi:hypothetical protein
MRTADEKGTAHLHYMRSGGCYGYPAAAFLVALGEQRVTYPQHPVSHQKSKGIFCEILPLFSVVRGEKLCYNVCN